MTNLIYVYSDEITDLMLKHHQSLSEKDPRKYAAIEAVKLGNGTEVLKVNK